MNQTSVLSQGADICNTFLLDCSDDAFITETHVETSDLTYNTNDMFITETYVGTGDLDRSVETAHLNVVSEQMWWQTLSFYQ